MTFLLPDQWDLTLQASQDNNVTVQKPESGLSCNDPENLTHSQPVMDVSMLNIISRKVSSLSVLSWNKTASVIILFLDLFHVSAYRGDWMVLEAWWVSCLPWDAP